MTVRKTINLFLIVLLLGAQLAIAQHASVHLTIESGRALYEHNHQDAPDHQKHQNDHDLCQLCLLTQSFTQLVTFAGPALPVPSVTVSDSYLFANAVFMEQGNPASYAARAPPSF